MALPVDQNAPDAPPVAATDLLGANGADTIISQDGASQADASPAGIVVAAAGDGLKVDLTLLGLDDLLDLPVIDNGPDAWKSGQANDSASESRPAGLAQLLATADMPADLTDLDLDQVLGLNLAGAALPTVLEVAKMPTDLTALELAQVLGLELAGDTLPTLQEVVQIAVQGFNSRDSQADRSDANGPNTDDAEVDVPVSDTPSSNGVDFSFIDNQSLIELAQTNSAQIAKAVSQGQANGKAFGSDAPLSATSAKLKSVSDVSNSSDNGKSSSAAADNSSSSNNSGSNVINGTTGDDVLNGTTGSDKINGKNGNDTLDGGSGDDTLSGGNGDDVLVWDASDSDIGGGNGDDTLRVDAGDADITTFGGTITGIENVDLVSDTGANALTLTAQDVLDMSGTDTLTIDGDVGDSVDASNGWTDGGVVGAYHVYTQGAATLNVDTDVSVNANILL